MKKVCAGWRDFNKDLHTCGVVMFDNGVNDKIISHGLCESCRINTEHVLAKWCARIRQQQARLQAQNPELAEKT